MGESWERPGSDVAREEKPWTSGRGPEDPVGSRPPLASGCLHLNPNPFHYVVPANELSADQSRVLDDTRQDCGRGVAWAGALGRFVGPFPGCFPCHQESGATAFNIVWNEHRLVCRIKAS